MDKKIAVVQFPGSNCEDESIFALRRAGIPCEQFLWNAPVEKLKEYAGYFIVGGFSYQDRSRAGVIASLDSVMREITGEAKKGKVVLGICNGAQVLVETGLVPGYDSLHLGMVLAPNRMERSGKLVGVGYYNDYCYLQTQMESGRNAFNRKLKPSDRIHIPFAHAEGRFVFEETLADQMEEKGMLAFRYVDDQGNMEADYPVNPNGSERNVAAVTNLAGNVMAMMPHPERVVGGDAIFESIGDYLTDYDQVSLDGGALKEPARDSHEDAIPPGKLELDKKQMPVKLIITDNTAYSIEDALEKKGYHVKVDRWVLWSIESDAPLTQSQHQELVNSGELLNTNKEWIDELSQITSCDENSACFLVDSPVNPVAAMKLQTLKKRFGMDHLKDIQMRMIWKIENLGAEGIDWTALVKTHIFHNPVSDTILRLS